MPDNCKFEKKVSGWEISALVFSFLFSLFAVVISYLAYTASKNHNQLSLKPLLAIELDYHPSKDFSGLILNNLGNGLAIVECYDVKVDGKSVPHYKYGGMKTAIALLGIDENWLSFRPLRKNDIYQVNSSTPFLAVASSDYHLQFTKLTEKLDRLEVYLAYKSLYNNKSTATYPPNLHTSFDAVCEAQSKVKVL
ncbi:hypothetical protein [Alteromonas sp. ASW11-130]|uniref:hypothetical protein n=1 Tax=Alteromonas sp. ASW11-130 TaxID=3015775 RepID=UPI002241CC23|nr:hypothetical protein [Alteromonas sp. ASW11-130]MCW8091162.1 hypothetical protein [Alteromonas sp. ASW11-130]